jgi:hypothetical protein
MTTTALSPTPGTPVPPEQIGYTPQPRPQTDQQRLIDWYLTHFVRKATAARTAFVGEPASKAAAYDRSRASLAFTLELAFWLPVAQRLYTEKLADELEISRERAGDETLRSTGEERKAEARRECAQLEQIKQQLELVQDTLRRFASLDQTAIRAMAADEFSGAAEGITDAPDDRFDLPATDTIAALARR